MLWCTLRTHCITFQIQLCARMKHPSSLILLLCVHVPQYTGVNWHVCVKFWPSYRACSWRLSSDGETTFLLFPFPAKLFCCSTSSCGKIWKCKTLPIEVLVFSAEQSSACMESPPKLVADRVLVCFLEINWAWAFFIKHKTLEPMVLKKRVKICFTALGCGCPWRCYLFDCERQNDTYADSKALKWYILMLLCGSS